MKTGNKTLNSRFNTRTINHHNLETVLRDPMTSHYHDLEGLVSQLKLYRDVQTTKRQDTIQQTKIYITVNVNVDRTRINGTYVESNRGRKTCWCTEINFRTISPHGCVYILTFFDVKVGTLGKTLSMVFKLTVNCYKESVCLNLRETYVRTNFYLCSTRHRRHHKFRLSTTSRSVYPPSVWLSLDPSTV